MRLKIPGFGASGDGSRGLLAEKYFAAAHRFEALSLRERALIVAGLVATSIAFWDAVAMRSLYARERASRQALAQIAPLGAGTQDSDLAALVDSERTLTQEFERRRTELKRGAAALVDPTQMPDVLAKVIASTAGLRMVRIASLPVEELRAIEDTEGQGSTGVIETNALSVSAGQVNRIPAVAFVHGMEIVVEGDYGAIQRYVRTLERQPWRFIWRRIELDSSAHPRITAKIVVATLGLNRHWLAL